MRHYTSKLKETRRPETILHDGSIFDGYRCSEEERAGGVQIEGNR